MVNNITFEILGEKINSYVEQTNKPKKVLFLHGFNSSFKIFEKIINEKNRDFDVATFDFPGCGSSSCENKVCLEIYQQITREFIKLIGYNKCIIVSHSLGAVSALRAVVDGYAQYAILTSPYNYYWNTHPLLNQKMISQYKENSFKNSILELNGKMKTGIEKINFEMAKFFLKNNKFHFLCFEQIFNTEYTESVIRPLFNSTHQYSIITGKNDFYVPYDTCVKVANDQNIEIISFDNVSHHLWIDINQSQTQMIIGYIEHIFDKDIKC
ncbi:alpha/beta fold hydrolase [Mycoplasma phocoenae]|uniref:Alpha/beta hydrolase n=1 Tax=Mycoplasma phocoenae TaxID=754517 RepID=A0A858U7K4_9MOLU|nr:alpha/beta hydrolase [Mycoplasma phocoenae]QJG66758.1 alpha/beta hydrolase [Mycoplasma phocoenae]